MFLDKILPPATIHMIGIGGVSMSGIAAILTNWGFNVTGSDWAKSEATDKLNSMGILIAVVSLSPKNMVQELCSYHNLPIQMAISVPGRKAPLNVIKGNQTGYPKSTIYRILMDKLGIDKESVLAVGDESSDAREASKAGIYFLGCNWGGRNEVNDISNPMDILDYV